MTAEDEVFGRILAALPPARVPASRVRRIRARLAELYGVPRMPPHGHPIAELICTVLSQSTNDRNRDVAYLRLRERFETWEAVRDAPVEEVEEAIRPGGISKVKSVRIQAILEAISERGELSLDWLPDAGVDEARDYLCSLPGVGRRRPPASCCSPSACMTSRSTRTSRASAGGWASSARVRASTSCTTRCSG